MENPSLLKQLYDNYHLEVTCFNTGKILEHQPIIDLNGIDIYLYEYTNEKHGTHIAIQDCEGDYLNDDCKMTYRFTTVEQAAKFLYDFCEDAFCNYLCRDEDIELDFVWRNCVKRIN